MVFTWPFTSHREREAKISCIVNLEPVDKKGRKETWGKTVEISYKDHFISF